MKSSRGPLALLFGVVGALGACAPDDGKPHGSTTAGLTEAGAGGTPDAGGGKALGADCTAPTDCASGNCFVGSRASWCSLKCTPTNAPQICNVPPLDGTCNNQGYCRRPN